MKKKLKIFFYFLITLIVGFYTFKTLNTVKFNLTNEEFVSIIMDDPNSFNSTSKTKIFKNIVSSISNVNISNPITFISNSFKDIRNDNISSDMTKLVSSPTIYIYNTHQQEQYDSANLKDYNIELTVLTSSYILKECLEDNSVYAVVEETNMRRFLSERNLSYDKSYQLSRELLLKRKQEYPTLNYYIDIHRDSVSGDNSKIIIDDKTYARPMFVIGINNKEYQKNLSLMKALNNGFNQFNEKLSRGVYKRNATYNQDISTNAILIEIGGVDNTVDEVYNTTHLFCQILLDYLGAKDE
ncbi:MAG TPA: stage II sporulation protein P [Bacilli bacterium]|nr:stage II sporulation protein P [Bacilli bacterium]